MVSEHESATQPAEHILQRCVCLLLSCGGLGNHRKVELGNVRMQKDDAELNGEKDELGAQKRLFASKDLQPCQHAIMSVKHRLRALSVDGGLRLFGAGAYLVPRLGVTEAEAVLTDGQAVVGRLARDLAIRLPDLVEKRRAKLGPLFHAGDYPSPDEVEAAYRIDWRYVRFGTPENLEDVDGAAYARAVAQEEARLSDAYQDVILGLRQAARLVMRELADRLKPGEDGKPKVLRASALRDLQDLLQRLPVLNSVGEDDPLAAVVTRVGALAQGLDVEVLRANGSVRGMLLAAAEQATADLDHLVESGRRAFRL